MKGKLLTMVLAVVIVAVMIGVVFYATVGVKATKKDVNGPGDDPTEQERRPIAYGVFSVNLMIDNGVDRYTGSVRSASAATYPYISASQGKVYETQKVDLLGVWSDDMTAWVKCDIRGPGQFAWSWTADKVKFSLSEWGHKYVDFTSGRCFFWDAGSYSLTVYGYADGPSGQYELGSKIITFNVNI